LSINNIEGKPDTTVKLSLRDPLVMDSNPETASFNMQG